MNWKKVRGWLLLLLICADLFLAGNIARQVIQMRTVEHTALEDAAAVAQKRGIQLDPETVFAMPRRQTAYFAERNSAQERTIAQTLLGSVTAEEPGGGVCIYQTELGQISFRRGGAIEWTLRKEPEQENLRAFLEETGLPVSGAREQSGEEDLLVQSFRGRPIYNCCLSCTKQNGNLQLRGRWLLGEGQPQKQEIRSRAQMLMALCDVMERLALCRVDALEDGYYLQSEDLDTIRLEPVWAAETEGGTVLVSCLTGEQLLF